MEVKGTAQTAGDLADLIGGLNDIAAADVKTAMEADGGDLSSLMEALVNKAVWTEADGQLEMFNDSEFTNMVQGYSFTGAPGFGGLTFPSLLSVLGSDEFGSF